MPKTLEIIWLLILIISTLYLVYNYRFIIVKLEILSLGIRNKLTKQKSKKTKLQEKQQPKEIKQSIESNLQILYKNWIKQKQESEKLKQQLESDETLHHLKVVLATKMIEINGSIRKIKAEIRKVKSLEMQKPC